jgi:hypothetical protein
MTRGPHSPYAPDQHGALLSSLLDPFNSRASDGTEGVKHQASSRPDMALGSALPNLALTGQEGAACGGAEAGLRAAPPAPSSPGRRAQGDPRSSLTTGLPATACEPTLLAGSKP